MDYSYWRCITYLFKYVCICKNIRIYVYINMDSQIKNKVWMPQFPKSICVYLCAYKNKYSIYMYVCTHRYISTDICTHMNISAYSQILFFSILIPTLYYSMLLNYLIPVSSFQTENTFNIYRLAIIPLSIATHYSFL